MGRSLVHLYANRREGSVTSWASRGVLDPCITAFGLAVQMLGKMWFIDRMALLYDEVVETNDGVRPASA